MQKKDQNTETKQMNHSSTNSEKEEQKEEEVVINLKPINKNVQFFNKPADEEFMYNPNPSSSSTDFPQAKQPNFNEDFLQGFMNNIAKAKQMEQQRILEASKKQQKSITLLDIVIIGGGIVLGGIAGYYIYKNFFGSSEEIKSNNSKTLTTQPPDLTTE